MDQWSSTLVTRYETLGAVTGSTAGTTVTAHATANTKGTPVSLGQTTFAWQWTTIQLARPNTALVDHCVDIMVDDGAGNRFVLIPDLRLWGRFANFPGVAVSIPLQVPSGARLHARASGSTGGVTLQVLATGASNGLRAAPGYPRCRALFTPANSRGVTISGGENAKGSWISLAASTAGTTRAMFAMLGAWDDQARALNHYLFDLGVGGSGTQHVIVPDILLCVEGSADIMTDNTLGPWPCNIPAGSTVWARSQSTAAVGSTEGMFDMGLYGLGT